MKKYIILPLATVITLLACKVDPKIASPLPVGDLEQIVPQDWPEPHYKFEENPLSESRFVLGRSLFYETMLSKDNQISCGSCHQNFAAFANKDHAVSHGVYIDSLPREGVRNAPGIFNLNWHPYFMWDGGSSHIELQPVGPITNTLEMAENIGSVVSKLQASARYRNLFRNAYGDETVTSQRMLKCLAQFMGMIYSYNSKFDRYKRHEENVMLSDQEQRGYELFQKNCNACHTEPLFSDFAFRSNGLPVNSKYNDNGRERITSQAQDRYKFKTPSLRNVTLTYPYMHDGRFTTLEECLDHYTDPNKNTENLDQALVRPLPLSAQDKQDIISFLNTLTDYEFIKDKRFADPNF